MHGPPGPNLFEIFKILLALVRSGPRTTTETLGPGATAFGPWVPYVKDVQGPSDPGFSGRTVKNFS